MYTILKHVQPSFYNSMKDTPNVNRHVWWQHGLHNDVCSNILFWSSMQQTEVSLRHILINMMVKYPHACGGMYYSWLHNINYGERLKRGEKLNGWGIRQGSVSPPWLGYINICHRDINVSSRSGTEEPSIHSFPRIKLQQGCSIHYSHH
jgi:hypothetical protein